MTTPPEIRFNQPTLEGQEVAYVEQAVRGGHTSMNGPFARKVTALLEDELDAAGVLLTTSCTDALEMAAMLLRLEPGDTVIVPSFTFVSSALAFIREGARIVFADGRPLGSFGRMSAVSFHETKSFTCGEGGALVLNDPADVERANILYEKGTDRRAFEDGRVDKYTWRDTGSSFGMSDILAAYLLGQLEAREAILAKRRAVVERYQARLAPEAGALGYEVPVMPGHRDYAYHLYYVLLEDADARNRVQKALRAAGVQASFHFVPLHDSDGGRRFRAHDTDCPVTDEITGRLLRLPVHNALTVDDADRISDALLEALA
jgi:dTDP-4-amino-4,6-dideoxygalactose transaminase